MNKINDRVLADNLISLRAAAGLSQRELAHRAGIAATQLSRYETGRSRPRPMVLDSLAQALDVPVASLYGVPNVAVEMPLRDDFAAKAMQAQLTAFWAMETHHGWSHDEIAREAYKMADAMLAERGAQ
jgi:transcriptional regulator with XRE-family HTH domain